jgi:hypothetical protein
MSLQANAPVIQATTLNFKQNHHKEETISAHNTVIIKFLLQIMPLISIKK